MLVSSYLARAFAMSIHTKLFQAGHAIDHTNRVRVKPPFANVEMLNHIKCYVTDEWLRVDHQPWLALRPQYISSVKVGGEKFVCRGRPCERAQNPQSLIHQT